MGKRDKAGVGRSLIKDRGKGNRAGKLGKESWLHTSELNDGDDYNKLHMQSVTEESALDEFLATAELAGTEFVAEKLNISVVPSYNKGGLPSVTEEQRIREVQEHNREFLSIPRRPSWDTSTTAEQLDQLEKESFLEWRRGLAQLQEKDDIILTPFERNLQFWRQLWRVVERSDVVVQIVDARNPLLFHCEDLESYVKEVDSRKVNVLLVNKADLLTQEQRETWAKYFQSINVRAIFWSAVIETEKHLSVSEEQTVDEDPPETSASELASEENVLSDEHVTKFLDLPENVPGSSSIDDEFLEENDDVAGLSNVSEQLEALNTEEVQPRAETVVTDQDQQLTMECQDVTMVSPSDGGLDGIGECELAMTQDDLTGVSDKTTESLSSTVPTIDRVADCSCEGEVTRVAGKAVDFYTSGHLLSGEELLGYCQWLHQEYGEVKSSGQGGSSSSSSGHTVIGLVGYPNVGKSSTINAILQAKKVPVSATPGRTKHFQTLFVDENVCLCDCPGLVFPSFVSTKAEMVVSGILPIDQMKDHIGPVSLVCRRIPRDVLETVYGINLVLPQEGEDPNREPFAEELLNAYGYSKGYMTRQGRPDGPRSARYILKDYVNGKLLFCHAPRCCDPAVFQVSFTSDTKTVKRRPITQQQMTNKTNSLDKDFFKQKIPKSFVTASTGTAEHRRQLAAALTTGTGPVVKPWKKHGNRNKKEKLRRLHDKP